eukprot:768737-Hanusia_phi.AAC.10
MDKRERGREGEREGEKERGEEEEGGEGEQRTREDNERGGDRGVGETVGRRAAAVFYLQVEQQPPAGRSSNNVRTASGIQAAECVRVPE